MIDPIELEIWLEKAVKIWREFAKYHGILLNSDFTTWYLWIDDDYKGIFHDYVDKHLEP